MLQNSSLKKRTSKLDIDVLKIKTERNGLGAVKTILVLSIIGLQLAVFVFSYVYLIWFFQSFLLISLILSLCTCIYALNTNKNSQSKPIWIMFLLLCFSFGYIFYFIADERVFWARYKKRYEKILISTQKLEPATPSIVKEADLFGCYRYLHLDGKFEAYFNTQVKYYFSGTNMFDDIIADIKKAQNFIFIEFFIISDGVLLERVLSLLKEKVKEGLDVRIIYDDLGSHRTLKRKTKKRIKKMGIKIISFNKVLPKISVLLNYRDHRKIVVIDGKVGYTGGVNLADEYINEKRLYGYWKDAGVRLFGAATDGFTMMFLRKWEFLTKKKEDKLHSFLGLYEECENAGFVMPFADGLEYNSNIAKNAYINLISEAKEKILMMSPYFVLDDVIETLLINKAKAGVVVKLILPEIADKKMVYIVSRNNAEKLIKYGVQVFVMKNSFVHSKVILTESSAIVGSINMDLRSFYQQFECGVLLNDKNVLNDINADFNNTIKKSLIVNEENKKRNSVLFRMVAGVVNILSPFM